MPISPPRIVPKETTITEISNRLSSVTAYNAYRERHRHNSFYHDPAWADVIRSCFGHETHWITVKQNDRLTGVLPLVFLKSRLFGKALVSMPYFNYGGILADDSSVTQILVKGALDLKAKLKADYIELRQTEKLDSNWPFRSNKVNMLLSLPGQAETLMKGFKSKLRNQIRRPEKEGCTFHWGQVELLPEFYSVFAENMRDLGTPVYPRRFFKTILEKFSGQSNIAVVRLRQKPVAAAFLVHYQNKMEIPWASSLRSFNPVSPNMMLYWGVLERAIAMEMIQFDFGRSSVGSGTYQFKEQWGALPHPTFWIYPGSAASRLPEHSPQSNKFFWATQIWRRLPLFLTNTAGPWIVKNIP